MNISIIKRSCQEEQFHKIERNEKDAQIEAFYEYKQKPSLIFRDGLLTIIRNK